jgi:hypothetical protein
MEYSYSLVIAHSHSLTIDEHGKYTRFSTAWHNFVSYVRSKRGNCRKDAEAELSAFNAVLDLYKSELLFKSEADMTFFLIRFS